MNMPPMTPEQACGAIIKYARAALATVVGLPHETKNRVLNRIADTLYKQVAHRQDGKPRA